MDDFLMRENCSDGQRRNLFVATTIYEKYFNNKYAEIPLLLIQNPYTWIVIKGELL
jgi:hypothetical protein